MRNIPFILKIIITAVLIVVVAWFARKDILKFKEFLVDNPISFSLKIERDKVKKKAMMVTINHYRPDLTQWKDFIRDETIPDKRFMSESIRYYEVISSYVPDIAEAQHMLALCHGLLGDVSAALILQEQAVMMEPHFFWSWYNLGVLYYRQDEFKKSAEAFHKALSVSPQATVRIMGTSKIYVEVLRGGAQATAGEHLQQGYRQAARMLEASMMRLRGLPVAITESEISLKLF